MYLTQGFNKEIYLFDLSYNVWMVIILNVDSELYDEGSNTFQGAFENIFTYCYLHFLNKCYKENTFFLLLLLIFEKISILNKIESG